jgi:hypothetical protein
MALEREREREREEEENEMEYLNEFQMQTTVTC